MYGIVASRPVNATASARNCYRTAPHESAARHIAVLGGHRPQPRRQREYQRVHDNRVGQREEPAAPTANTSAGTAMNV